MHFTGSFGVRIRRTWSSSDGSDASQPQPLSLSVELGLAWTALNSPVRERNNHALSVTRHVVMPCAMPGFVRKYTGFAVLSLLRYRPFTSQATASFAAAHLSFDSSRFGDGAVGQRRDFGDRGDALPWRRDIRYDPQGTPKGEILAGPWCKIPSSPTGRIIQTVCPDVLMNLIPLLIVHGLADTASHVWSGSLARLPV